MLLLKRAKNGLSHFLLQAHTSSMRAFKSTLWYLFKIGFLLLNFVTESIRDNIFQLNALYLGSLYSPPVLVCVLLFFPVCLLVGLPLAKIAFLRIPIIK